MERTRRTVLRGLLAFRWLAWCWMVAVLVLARGRLVAPVVAALLVGAAGLVSIALTQRIRRRPQDLVRAPLVGLEVAVAIALLLADGLVYDTPHAFTPAQPLGVAWPLAGLLTAGVAFGPVVGAVTGLGYGAARALSSVLSVVPDPEPWLGPLTAQQLLSLVTTTVLYVLAGGTAGHAMRLLVRAEERQLAAEREVAQLEARADVARGIHDGVLQTLAVVARRTDDPVLERLARDQERTLRRTLFGPVPGDGARPELVAALHEAAGRTERAFDLQVEVLVPDDLPTLDASIRVAVVGAVGEALTNAGKHAQATRVIVYLEPDGDEVLVSVHDDGCGFDPGVVVAGQGLAGSIRGRIEDAGGRVELDAAPGRGTEVRLRVPAARPGGSGAEV